MFQLLISEAEKFNAEMKKAVMQMVIFNLLVPCFTFIPGVYALNPSSQMHSVFGKGTTTVIIIHMLTHHIAMFLGTPGTLLVSPMQQHITKLWNKKIYIKYVHDTLLQHDIEAGNKEKCLNDIHKEFEKVEKWATQVNQVISPANGAGIFVFCLFMSICFGSSAIIQVIRDDSSDAWKVMTISSLGFVVFIVFMNGMIAIQNPNKYWESQCRTVFNDPRLQLRIEEVFGGNFDKWLLNHELSSQRVFGVQVTSGVLKSVGVSLGSVVSVVVYYIFQKTISDI